MSELINVNDVHKNYKIGEVEVNALRGVSLSIDYGELITIGGPSGSGKSTLLHIIGCLDKPCAGTCHVYGKNIALVNDDELSRLRAEQIGFVFQSYNLIPVLSVYENIEYPLLLCGQKKRRDVVMEIIQEVGLEKYKNHFPNELSGGQQQRVAVARSLVTQPNLLITDEPTANLDLKTGDMIVDLMFKMSEKRKMCLIICTHNSKLFDLGKRQIYLEDGLIKHDIVKGS